MQSAQAMAEDKVLGQYFMCNVVGHSPYARCNPLSIGCYIGTENAADSLAEKGRGRSGRGGAGVVREWVSV